MLYAPATINRRLRNKLVAEGELGGGGRLRGKPDCAAVEIIPTKSKQTTIRYLRARVEIHIVFPSVIAAALCNGLDFGVAGDRRCWRAWASQQFARVVAQDQGH